MRHSRKFTTAAAAFLAAQLCLYISSAAQAQAQPVEIAGVRVGFADCYKAGLWTPVDVLIKASDKAPPGVVKVTVPDGDGVPSSVSIPVGVRTSATDGETTAIRLYVRFGRVSGAMKVVYEADGKPIAQEVFQTIGQDETLADARRFRPAIESQDIIATIGGTLGVDDAVLLQRLPKEERQVVASLDSCDRLPDRWCGYEGVNAVVLSTSRPEIYRMLTADDPRVKALDEWVRMGGKLVLCVGSRGTDVLGDDSPLKDFVPGRFDKTYVLRQTSSLESYCHSMAPLPKPKGEQRVSLGVSWLVDVRGSVEARQSEVPLVIRSTRGLGQVIFLAADLDQPPLSEWSDRGMLAAMLLDLSTAPPLEAERGAQSMHYGYTDIAGQLRSALDRFEGVEAAPFWVIAAIVGVYLALLGPVEYLFLRKVARRMAWTWFTFPLLVVAFSAGAFVLAQRLKGGELRVHQADLIDVDVAASTARGTTWANVFSPRSETYDLSLRPRMPGAERVADASIVTAWLGLPGKALGGMDSKATDALLGGGQYEFSPSLDSMRGVPIQIWSTKSFTARWTARCGPTLAASLVEEKQALSGSITNTFDFPLSQCMVAYDRWAYELGTLEPGQTAQFDPETKRSEFTTYLTGRRLVYRENEFRAKGSYEKYRQESTPYDPAETDAAYILRSMMFYRASGGRQYTGMNNNYQEFVDLSDLLKNNRAILVAVPPAGANTHCELLRDGRPMAGPDDQRTVIYRFVLEVKNKVEP
jgi:hypothetical protein